MGALHGLMVKSTCHKTTSLTFAVCLYPFLQFLSVPPVCQYRDKLKKATLKADFECGMVVGAGRVHLSVSGTV